MTDSTSDGFPSADDGGSLDVGGSFGPEAALGLRLNANLDLGAEEARKSSNVVSRVFNCCIAVIIMSYFFVYS